MERIITLTTDFGLKDPYQGAMKGAILSINPGARIVDITHLITPGNILEGALVLLDAYRFFPHGTIHASVVDPGVGGVRKPVLVETERYFFVGPDNGLFSLIARREKVRRVVELTEKRYFLKEVSNTFHGRDVFGPVAAYLSLGVEASLFGLEKRGLCSIELPAPVKGEDGIAGEVIYIDSFGNILTNISGEEIAGTRPEDMDVEVKGFTVKGLKKTYNSAEKGSLVALVSSSGHLEIAVNGGSASKATGASVGDMVTVRPGNG